MAITIRSSREFNRDASGAKKAAAQGPVIITDRGKPTHVLLTIADYQRLLGQPSKITQVLAMPDAAEVEFTPGKVVLPSRHTDFT
ncbi:MAG: type II toxin-antitoxin system Phd/YefM family antitoxin [Proteobacteria bacterium]|nr:type II toxin-antitoxin system Phd/YefM family antitoxin [Pseudomonadota bacterium]